MKIHKEEVIHKDNLFNNNLYFIKYNNHKVALYREDKLYVLGKNNTLKEIPYEESNIFAWYSDYSRNSEILELMQAENIDTLYKKTQEKMLSERPKYAAGFLSEEDKKKILTHFSENIPENWKTICHHMTMNLGRLQEKDKHLLGKEFKSKITHLGINKDIGIMALKIDTDIPSKNEHKHITLALKEGTKPFRSNDIQEWIEIEPLEISLKVGEFLTNQNISYGKENKKKNKLKY